MAAPFYSRSDAGVSVYVRARPGASANEFAGLREDVAGRFRLIIRVTAPPENGKANAAIIKLLSKKTRIAKSAFAIVAGETSSDKEILVTATSDTAFQAIRSLTA